MKKTAIALTAVLLLTGMATALEGHDGGDGDMSITNNNPDQTGENSSSTETSPEGDTEQGEFNPLEAVANFVASLFG
jgi:hypothetical protein